MAEIEFKIDASALERLGNRLQQMNAPLILSRAINHTGAKAKTAVIRALVQQTGLNRKVIVRAVKVRKATAGQETRGVSGRMSYALTTRGGDISLKSFNARETSTGVSAAPGGRRINVAGAFIRGGAPGKRVWIQKLGGHVFMRASKGRLAIVKQVSDVSIPDEMLKGATKQAFERIVDADLSARVEHEINYALNTGGF